MNLDHFITHLHRIAPTSWEQMQSEVRRYRRTLELRNKLDANLRASGRASIGQEQRELIAMVLMCELGARAAILEGWKWGNFADAIVKMSTVGAGLSSCVKLAFRWHHIALANGSGPNQISSERANGALEKARMKWLELHRVTPMPSQRSVLEIVRTELLGRHSVDSLPNEIGLKIKLITQVRDPG